MPRCAIRRRIRPWSIALGAALLGTACATLPTARVPLIPWAQRRAALQSITGFELDGRMAAHAGQHGFSAGLRWHQHLGDASIDLRAPLGLGAAHIRQSGDSLTVSTSQGERLDDQAARQRLEQTLGFQPPIASLHYWLLGVNDPATAAQESLDTRHRLRQLVQDGWRIDYESYMRVQQHWLPQRLTLTRAGLRVLVIVNAWRL